MSCPTLQWSAIELVQSLCETSLKLVELTFVVSVLLVKQFPSWNVAHQQYLRSLLHWVPRDLWGYCPCCQWMDCMPHSGMLSLQTGRLVSTRYYKASSLQECITAVLNPVISPGRPGLACRRLPADYTKICSELETVVWFDSCIVFETFFSLSSWFGLFLLFPLLS